jgi:uncharacterized protein
VPDSPPADPPSVTIALRPIGSPLTIGMSGLAVASVVQSGLDLGWIAKDETRNAGLILIAVPFVLQVIACVFAYLGRDGALGACVGLLAGTWLGMGLVHLVSPGQAHSGALGLLLISAGGLLALSATAVALAKLLPAAVIALAALRFMLAGIDQLSPSGFLVHAAGIAGLVVAGLAAYAVLAFELEGQRRRTVLPTFRRARGQAALRGRAAEKVDDVLSEAGVRQTT